MLEFFMTQERLDSVPDMRLVTCSNRFNDAQHTAQDAYVDVVH